MLRIAWRHGAATPDRHLHRARARELDGVGRRGLPAQPLLRRRDPGRGRSRADAAGRSAGGGGPRRAARRPRRADPRGRGRHRPRDLRRGAALGHEGHLAGARRVRGRARAPGARARHPAAGDLPRDAADERRARGHADPAPARRRRPRGQPPRPGLLRRGGPRGAPRRRLARRARCRRGRPPHQVAPPPGHRAPGRGSRRDGLEHPRRPARGDRGPGAPLRPRGPVAPRGRPGVRADRLARARGGGRPQRRPRVAGPRSGRWADPRSAPRGAMLARAVRRLTAIRLVACTALAAGLAAPLVRRRLKLPPPVVTATAATAPLALCVLVPRSRLRDAGVVCLQMWAYVATYQMPNDDPLALERRVRIDYPVRLDRAIGRGTTPTLRLQRAFGRPGRINVVERTLIWSHWIWFLVPHGTTLFLLFRHRERFPRGACLIYGTFDLGLIGYWAVPTAPPWYAAARGRMADGRTPELRRMMVEYGEPFWKSRGQPLYVFLGGNPLAAMPSLHFATSVMAAHVLSETGPVAGAVGWAYATTLGVALVYLGEHYVVDLAVGLTLTEGVRRAAPLAE